MVNNIENIKPNLLTQINTRMDEVEEIAMQNEVYNNIFSGPISQTIIAKTQSTGRKGRERRVVPCTGG